MNVCSFKHCNMITRLVPNNCKPLTIFSGLKGANKGTDYVDKLENAIKHLVLRIPFPI